MYCFFSVYFYHSSIENRGQQRQVIDTIHQIEELLAGHHVIPESLQLCVLRVMSDLLHHHVEALFHSSVDERRISCASVLVCAVVWF